MFNNIEKIVAKLKNDTNNQSDIVYRKKVINKSLVYIVYIEALTSSDKISDFIVRSLTNIDKNLKRSKKLMEQIENNISNFKVKKVYSYQELCQYLNKGFTIILLNDNEYCLALETKADLSRSISVANSETTIRGPKDCFVEDFQKNMGLIRRRVKSNDLWTENVEMGKYTHTQVSIIYVNGIVKKKLVQDVKKKLETLEIDGVINEGLIKNLLSENSKTIFPTIHTTERPDVAVAALLKGKVVVLIENTPFVLIVPGEFNDYFKTPEDVYTNNINASFVRMLKYITFFIALLTPAIYIALVNYNQEMVPPQLLVSFAIQRDTVPFPAFFEAFIMILSFEIIRESDLRVPGFTGSSLSIVGALILGDAAVNAGVVSPIMIIIIAITALSSLPFTEPEVTNSLRSERIIFMIGASFLGIVGVILILFVFIVRLANASIFGTPYLTPFAPFSSVGFKDSIIKLPFRKLNKREKYLSDNTIREVNHEEN